MKRYCVMYYEYGLTRMAVRNFFYGGGGNRLCRIHTKDSRKGVQC